MIGKIVSHYEIIEKLGEGGMGVVYKAQDTSLERFVALKFLPPHLSASEQDKARFRQEAKAAAALNHPNVCSIIEIAEHEGQMFIVMEFVDGHTLREKLGVISFKQAIDIAIQVAEGLGAAHEKGIVHRDIKPENIMIRKDGIAQIMDFGLAKLRASGSKITRLTKEGSTIGTAGYMSPEQVQGQETDHRSDIFSYGVVLYEMLTGQLPFKGIHETALAYEIVNVDAPPMSAVKPEIDPVLDGIVLECLEKDPNERAQSVKQVSIDLKRVKRESTRSRVSRIIPASQIARRGVQPQPAPAPEQSQARRWMWPAISGFLLVSLIFSLYMMWQKSGGVQRSPMHLSVVLPANALHVGGGDGVAISPDGKYIAYSGGGLGNPQVVLRRLDQMTTTTIPGTDGADEVVFSPDGQWIAFAQGAKLEKVSVSGGTPVEVCEVEGLSRGLWWDPNGYIYYGHISRGVQRVSANGGASEVVTLLDSATGELSHRFPQLLPDGKTVIYTIKPNNITSFGDGIIAAQRAGDKEKKVLIRGGSYAKYVGTGHLLYARGDFIYAVAFDPNKLEVTGQPVQVAEGGWMNDASGQAEFSVSNAGTLVYSPLGSLSLNTFRLSWMDRQGKTTRLLDSLRNFATSQISPDGQKLVIDISAANDDIWIYQFARGTLTRLTFAGGNNNFPIWSSDGKYVIYSAEKGATINLFRKPWDGSGAEERLTTSSHSQIATSMSPDGTQLAYTENGDIWILPLDKERKPSQFIGTPATEGGAQFSPDGKWIAYQSDESGKSEIYVVPFPKRDGKWQVSNGGGITPLWTSDGKQLVYLGPDGIMSLEITQGSPLNFSTPHKVCTPPDSVAGVFDMAHDGQRFVVSLATNQLFTVNRLNIVTDWFTELKQAFAAAKN